MSNKSVFTSGQLGKFIGVNEDHGVGTPEFQQGLSLGLFSDVAEFLGNGNHEGLDRDKWRATLGLDPLTFELTVRSDKHWHNIAQDEFCEVNRDVRIEKFPMTAKAGYTVKAHLVRGNERLAAMVGSACPSYLHETLVKAFRSEKEGATKPEELVAFISYYRSCKSQRPVAAIGAAAGVNGAFCVLCLEKQKQETDGPKMRLTVRAFSTVLREQYDLLFVPL
ncbi:MAG: hypothetical protein V4481_00565 [Patescibacteria group bacterium]